MVHSVKQGKTERQSYSKINEVIEVPNLIENQKQSYQWFIDKGMQQVFNEVSPVTDVRSSILTLRVILPARKTDPARRINPMELQSFQRLMSLTSAKRMTATTLLDSALRFSLIIK